MWGITEILGAGLRLWNSIFGAKQAADVKKAEQINNENERQQQFNKDLFLASRGDKDALERVRTSLSRNP